MRIGNAADRPRREMDELRPGEVSRHPVFLRPLSADSRRNPLLDVRHRFSDRARKALKISGSPVSACSTDRLFGAWKVQSRSRRPALHSFAPSAARRFPDGGFPPAPRTPPASRRRPGQKRGRLAVPLADDLLLLRIVVLVMQSFRIILAGSRRGTCVRLPATFDHHIRLQPPFQPLLTGIRKHAGNSAQHLPAGRH